MKIKIDTKQKGYILVIIAGIFWSTTGLFAVSLMERGISSLQVAFIRMLLGSVILFFYCIIKDRNLLKINKNTFIYCVILGIVCQAGFNVFYFAAVDKIGVSTSAVLLYTSPLFLTIFSRIVFKENINTQKIVTLIICFVGSLLAVTGGRYMDINLNYTGIILGVLSAIAYASMSILTKKILGETKSITVLLYSFFIGSLFISPICGPLELTKYLIDIAVLPYIIGLGTISAAGAYICYVEGIGKDIDLSIAGILASGELIGSVILGWLVLKEEFLFIKFIGIVLMMLAGIFSIVDIYKLKSLFVKNSMS